MNASKSRPNQPASLAEGGEPIPAEPQGRLSWAVRPRKRRLFLPITGALILALDWLLFSSNAVSAGLATPVVALLGLALGGAGTIFLEIRFGGDPWWKAALKGLLAGLAVGAPWPIGGTLVGGWILLFSGLGEAKDEMLRR